MKIINIIKPKILYKIKIILSEVIVFLFCYIRLNVQDIIKGNIVLRS